MTNYSFVLGCNYSTIGLQLHQLGKVNKLGWWISHQLTQQRMTICNSFLLKHNRYRLLQQIVTNDSSMLTIDASVNGSIVDPELKTDLHLKKIILSVSCDFQGIIYFELLPNTTVDSKLYSNQLENLKVDLQAKRLETHKVCLLHDNARAHTAKITRKELKELGWQILPHASYSPDLAPFWLPSVPFAS